MIAFLTLYFELLTCLKIEIGISPGDSVVKILYFQCRGNGFVAKKKKKVIMSLSFII